MRGVTSGAAAEHRHVEHRPNGESSGEVHRLTGQHSTPALTLHTFPCWRKWRTVFVPVLYVCTSALGQYASLNSHKATNGLTTMVNDVALLLIFGFKNSYVLLHKQIQNSSKCYSSSVRPLNGRSHIQWLKLHRHCTY